MPLLRRPFHSLLARLWQDDAGFDGQVIGAHVATNLAGQHQDVGLDKHVVDRDPRHWAVGVPGGLDAAADSRITEAAGGD